MYSIHTEVGIKETYEEAEQQAKEQAARWNEDYYIMKSVAVAKARQFPEIEVIKV